MNEKDIVTEWQKLCDEFETARESHFQAFSAVNRKLVRVTTGATRINPTEKELYEFESTGKALEEIERRMTTLVRAHA